MKNLQIKDNSSKYIHFIGIGGISMSALAKLTLKNGHKVSGSDLVVSEVTKELKLLGAQIYIGHKISNIKNPDLIVISSAVMQNNAEVVAARDKGIKIISRAEYLGNLAAEYNNVIAISGMHGKTTTTAMITQVMLRCGLNPTVHIGGNYDLIKGNLYMGGKDFFLTEACEYSDSFLKITPTVSVVTNIEAEHLDYFKNLRNIKTSFNKFANLTKEVCFVYERDKNKINCQNIITFGINKGDVQAHNVKLNAGGKYSFVCYIGGEFFANIKLNCEGSHNVLNALACIAVCNYYGVAPRRIANALNVFKNVSRRFEYMGMYKNNIIIHDYAHHPTEIKNAIQMTKDTFNLPIICVFQPHTYSRTKTLFKKFLTSFKGVDELYILETYSARENYCYEGSAARLVNELRVKQENVFGAYTGDGFLKEFKKASVSGSVVLFLGAGNIEKAAEKLTSKSENKKYS